MPMKKKVMPWVSESIDAMPNARKARRATYSPTHVISGKPADPSTPDASEAACLTGEKSYAPLEIRKTRPEYA